MSTGAAHPSALLRWQLAQFDRQVPGLLDGDADAIHDARVATRRIRTVIPLVDGWPREADSEDLRSLFKALGRKLGRARDIDVRLTLLAELEERLPDAAPSIAAVRADERARRVRRAKAVVRALEQLDVRNGLRPVRFWSNGSWRQRVVDDIRSRARTAEEAIDHAAGLYFPRRLHRARIEVKKFRYAAEIADAAGVAPFAEPIAVLKKAQEILGEMHDREMIAELLERHADDGGVRDRDVRIARDLLDAEARAVHRRYLARRRLLFAVCRGLPREASRRQLPSPLLVATALAAASALLAPRSRVEPARSGAAAANRRPA